MKIKNEKGITLISLSITIIILIIMAGAGVVVGLEGIDTIDQSKEAGIAKEKTSIIEALKGEAEDLRTKRILKGESNNLTDDDIKNIMEAFVIQTNDAKANQEKIELSYENGKITSIKDFEITINEVREDL